MIGSRVEYGIASTLSSPVSRSKARTRGRWRAYATPSKRLRQTRADVGAGRRGIRTIASAAIAATYDTAFSPKHPASPIEATARPARLGPMTRDRLNWAEFSAIAFWRSLRPTRS